MRKYEVCYNVPPWQGTPNSVPAHSGVAYIFVEHVGDAFDGFWINKMGEFTTGEDSYLYVPSSKLEYIQKLESK